ncbi:hypothetical protein [Nocardiopsis tropica]|uniref:Transposase n=1 Tax=Nocardiopsis tropica TaxID=109330 RepID=A0ABU7L2K9_9ACTN|nr:hypothetical protein [Nocardiopsis umidischolae]MEE2055795.1 hypothetical protein [Nocardiopsis umidischolae]
MNDELDTLPTALYVKIDDELDTNRWMGRPPKLTDAEVVTLGIELLRPSSKREKKRKGESLPKSVRQLIESVNDTLKGQLDLEQHGGRTHEGVAIRVAQRVLAMAAAIWRNHKTGAPTMRSLVAFDH